MTMIIITITIMMNCKYDQLYVMIAGTTVNS